MKLVRALLLITAMVIAKPSEVHFVPKPKLEPTSTVQYELHPLIMIFIASFIAFHVAAVFTGLIAGWIYYCQNLGGFAP